MSLPASVEADTILAALDPEQREAAVAVRGPVCILAGAGTGKTRTITARIGYAVLAGIVPPSTVLAVTFTARAAGEMRARLRGLGVRGVQAMTFHAAALRQLSYFWPRAVGGTLPRLVDTKAALVTEAARRTRVEADRALVRDLAAEIEWAKVTQTPPDDYTVAAVKANRTPPLDAANVGHVYAAYEEVKRARGVIDFEDVLLLTVGVLEERADITDEVRSRYRWFTVDEYQDVSPLQQRLLDLWLGDRTDLCVVGDPSQTIYSFTGATPDFLVGFTRRFPAATLVRLIRDYRSTPQVVGLANALVASGRVGGLPPLQLVAQREAGPAPTLTGYDDEVAEAAGVATKIRRLIDSGVSASEIAVLFRVNAQSERYEEALADAGVPYLVRGGERFFARREVREAVLLLRAAAATGTRATVSEDAGSPAETGSETVGLAAEVSAVLAGAGWTPQPPSGPGAVRERWESLAALVRLAEEISVVSPTAGLRDLVADLDERAAAQHAPTVEGVTLASLHAAKGLEWDAVFLVGLSEGLMPIVHAQSPAETEEERRLLYVGITRARRDLALSWAASSVAGRRGNRRPSRFLDGLLSRSGRSGRTDHRSDRHGQTRSGGRSRGGLPTCLVCRKPLRTPADRKIGRCSTCPSDVDETLLDRLRAWRLEQARAQDMPAYVVFTDATLIAIAESRPTTLAELARVPGVGAVKLDRYGSRVLALCAEGR